MGLPRAEVLTVTTSGTWPLTPASVQAEKARTEAQVARFAIAVDVGIGAAARVLIKSLNSNQQQTILQGIRVYELKYKVKKVPCGETRILFWKTKNQPAFFVLRRWNL